MILDKIFQQPIFLIVFHKIKVPQLRLDNRERRSNILILKGLRQQMTGRLGFGFPDTKLNEANFKNERIDLLENKKTCEKLRQLTPKPHCSCEIFTKVGISPCETHSS